MAKKRHWRKRAKLQAGLNSTENIKVTEHVEKKVRSSQKQSETFKESSQNRKDATEGISNEKLLSAKVISGETCLDIECGSNKAVLYLSKMCLGSKGSCILFKGSWLTPNEFQFVSGRENAKDWKRSIRHNGSSLKLLFSKNLLQRQESPKKSGDGSEEKENNEQVLSKMSPETSEEEATTETLGKNPGNSLSIEEDEDKNSVAQCRGPASPTSVEFDNVAPCQGPLSQTSVEPDNVAPCQGPVSQTSVEPDIVAPCQGPASQTRVEPDNVSPCQGPASQTSVEPDNVAPCQGPVSQTSVEPDNVSPCQGPASQTSIENGDEIVTEKNETKEDRCTDKGTDPVKTEVGGGDTEVDSSTLEAVMDSSEAMQEVKETPDAPTLPPTTKLAKRRKKKGKAKKRWARSKSTTTHVARSRKSHIAEVDLPVNMGADDVTCAYETLKEEDKLAVFVKALRLLRKRDMPEVVPNTPDHVSCTQHHIHIEEKDQTIKSQSDVEDREMPVLEKEVDLLLPNRAVEPMQPHIFPSTVTPPPTPPLTASPDIDEIKRELKNIDQSVFESRLTPVEEGIKLKINRLVDDSEKAVKTESVETTIPEQELRSCTSKGVKDPAKHRDLLSKSLSDTHVDTRDPSGLWSKSLSDTHVDTRDPSGLWSKSLSETHVHTSGLSESLQCVAKESTKQTHILERHKHERKSLPCLPLSCPKKSETAHADFSVRISQGGGAISKGKETKETQIGGVSVVSTPYGPMLVPTEENFRLYHELLAAYSTMQHSIVRPEVKEKSPNTYVPNKKTVTHVLPSVTQQQSTTTAYRQGKSALFEGTNFHKRRNSPGVISPGVSVLGTKCETLDRKRKYSECEGALDLSIKKPKVESPVISVPHKYNYVMDQDTPIDFSMKKTTYSESTKPVNAIKQYNFISPVQRTSSIQNNQCLSNASTYPAWNNAQRQSENDVQNRQSDKGVHNRQDQSKSSFNSMWYGVTRQLDKDMTKWTVNNVCSFLACLEGCSEYAKMFQDQGINGRILPFLTTQHLTRTLGMKVGPALALQYAIGRFFKDNANPNHLGSRSRVSV